MSEPLRRKVRGPGGIFPRPRKRIHPVRNAKPRRAQYPYGYGASAGERREKLKNHFLGELSHEVIENTGAAVENGRFQTTLEPRTDSQRTARQGPIPPENLKRSPGRASIRELRSPPAASAGKTEARKPTLKAPPSGSSEAPLRLAPSAMGSLLCFPQSAILRVDLTESMQHQFRLKHLGSPRRVSAWGTRGGKLTWTGERRGL